MKKVITGINGESVKQLMVRARSIAASRDRRIGQTAYCLLCSTGTTGGDNHLCHAARELRDCREERKLEFSEKWHEIPASRELKRVIKRLVKILSTY